MTNTAKRTLPGPATAPYSDDGSLLEWVSPHAVRAQATDSHRYDMPREWRPNEPFTATLVLTGTERGRSAARFTWVGTGSLTGRRFPMFMTDVAALMMSADGVRNAVVTGEWIVVKRGQNYGIALLEALRKHGG